MQHNKQIEIYFSCIFKNKTELEQFLIIYSDLAWELRKKRERNQLGTFIVMNLIKNTRELHAIFDLVYESPEIEAFNQKLDEISSLSYIKIEKKITKELEKKFKKYKSKFKSNGSIYVFEQMGDDELFPNFHFKEFMLSNLCTIPLFREVFC